MIEKRARSLFHETIRYRVQDSAWKVWEALESMGSTSKAKARQLRATHERIADELELMNVSVKERQIRNLCESLFWENLVSREKIPSTGGAPPWAYWIKKTPKPEEMEITPDEEMQK